MQLHQSVLNQVKSFFDTPLVLPALTMMSTRSTNCPAFVPLPTRTTRPAHEIPHPVDYRSPDIANIIQVCAIFRHSVECVADELMCRLYEPQRLIRREGE